MRTTWIIIVVIALLGLIGEIKCIVKMCKCNWEPIGKAELFYTFGTFTFSGCVIGWVDIKDK